MPDRRTTPRPRHGAPRARPRRAPGATGNATARPRNACRRNATTTWCRAGRGSRGRWPGPVALARATSSFAICHTASECFCSGRRTAPTGRPSAVTSATATWSALRSAATTPHAGCDATAGSGSSSVTHSCTFPRGSSLTRHETRARAVTAASTSACCAGLKVTPASTTCRGPRPSGRRSCNRPPHHCATSFPAHFPCSPENRASESRRRRHAARHPRRNSLRPPKHQRGRRTPVKLLLQSGDRRLGLAPSHGVAPPATGVETVLRPRLLEPCQPAPQGRQPVPAALAPRACGLLRGGTASRPMARQDAEAATHRPLDARRLEALLVEPAEGGARRAGEDRNRGSQDHQILSRRAHDRHERRRHRDRGQSERRMRFTCICMQQQYQRTATVDNPRRSTRPIHGMGARAPRADRHRTPQPGGERSRRRPAGDTP